MSPEAFLTLLIVCAFAVGLTIESCDSRSDEFRQLMQSVDGEP